MNRDWVAVTIGQLRSKLTREHVIALASMCLVAKPNRLASDPKEPGNRARTLGRADLLIKLRLTKTVKIRF